MQPLQLLSSINKQIVKGLAATDLKLEEVGLLPKVEQEELPEDITDEDGNLLNDCAEVSPFSNLSCALLPPGPGCARWRRVSWSRYPLWADFSTDDRASRSCVDGDCRWCIAGTAEAQKSAVAQRSCV